MPETNCRWPVGQESNKAGICDMQTSMLVTVYYIVWLWASATQRLFRGALPRHDINMTCTSLVRARRYAMRRDKLRNVCRQRDCYFIHATARSACETESESSGRHSRQRSALPYHDPCVQLYQLPSCVLEAIDSPPVLQLIVKRRAGGHGTSLKK